MSHAAYNRGSRVVARYADASNRTPGAALRADLAAVEDANAHLLARVAILERDLARARRCLVAERAGRERLRVQLIEDAQSHEYARALLCKIAFRETK